MPYLIAYDVSPFIIDNIYEEEPIIYSIIKDDLKALHKLIFDCNIDINYIDYKGDTLLHACIYNDNERIIRYLIRNGIFIDNINSIGNTALLESISDKECHQKISKLLINLGADVNKTNYDNISPIYMSLINNKYDIFDDILLHRKFILEKDDIDKIISYCIRNRLTNYLELLLKRNKITNKYINKLIFLSIKKNYYNLIESICIIKNNLNIYDNKGRTPKLLAKLYKRHKILKIIENI